MVMGLSVDSGETEKDWKLCRRKNTQQDVSMLVLCVCVCVRESVCERERERVCVCVCV